MAEIYERVRQKRIQLRLSQDEVAKALGVSRSTFTQMENGNRKILAEEIAVLASLYGVSADTLLYDSAEEQTSEQILRSLGRLEEADRAEILSLIRFKEYSRIRGTE